MIVISPPRASRTRKAPSRRAGCAMIATDRRIEHLQHHERAVGYTRPFAQPLRMKDLDRARVAGNLHVAGFAGQPRRPVAVIAHEDWFTLDDRCADSGANPEVERAGIRGVSERGPVACWDVGENPRRPLRAVLDNASNLDRSARGARVCEGPKRPLV